MELGGNNNGGINGHRKIPRTRSGTNRRAPDSNTTKANNATTEDTECTVREQDRFMPIANVIRIMRQALPPHAKISDEAKETVQECVSEFIGFVTGEANDRCQSEQRRTITAKDLLWTMNRLGFDSYVEPLMLYLERYREIDGGDRGSARGEPLVRSLDPGSLGFPRHAPAALHPMGYREIDGVYRGLARGEPLVRPVDPGSLGFQGHPPAALHPMAAHYGYYGVYPVNGFVAGPSAGSGQSQVAMTFAGPSQATMAFAGQSQAAMAFAGPLQAAMAFAGPSQAAMIFAGP